MRFRYTQLPSRSGGTISEPILRAKLVGPAGRLTLSMVVDSGSSETMIPEWAMAAVGLPISKETVELGGIGGGSVTCRVASARFEFGLGQFNFTGRALVYPDTTQQLPILGQRDFFLKFYVAFAARDGVFLVDQYR